MYTPASDDEITGLVRYVDQQLAALRAAAVGLTDEQIRCVPAAARSSIGGLIKHVTYGMRGATQRFADGRPGASTRPRYAATMASFALADDETGAGVLAEFDEARVAYLAAARRDRSVGADDRAAQPVVRHLRRAPGDSRYYLVHQIEEMARHAGHADIIREQIDGMSVPAIVLSEAGLPANDFFQPYVPEPGTIGAR